ncbi:MAG: DUF1844 domain-containing protein [Phycisphaerales bacterium]|nr:DUF1844 domain-containing protein [Phycisphaerales bacterium]
MADQQQPEQPKIIIDSDWKAQAQAEKERLKQAEQQKQPGTGEGEEDPNRPIDFDDIVRMLASQALMYLGAIPDPESGRAILAPEMAKAHIDMLGVLEAKTKGNLSEREDQTLRSILNELRMQFAEISKAIEKAIAEGKIKPSDIAGPRGPGPMPGGAAPGGPSPMGG